MTEAEWMTCNNPKRLMEYLAIGYPNGRGSGDRIPRLLGCGFCRRLWYLLPHPESRKAVDVAERFADCLAQEGEFNWTAASEVAESANPDDLRQRSLKSLLPWVAAQAAHPVKGWFAAQATTEAVRIAADNNDPAAPKAQQALCQLIREIYGNPFRSLPPLSPTVLLWNDGTVSTASRQASMLTKLSTAYRSSPMPSKKPAAPTPTS